MSAHEAIMIQQKNIKNKKEEVADNREGVSIVWKTYMWVKIYTIVTLERNFVEIECANTFL